MWLLRPKPFPAEFPNSLPQVLLSTEAGLGPVSSEGHSHSHHLKGPHIVSDLAVATSQGATCSSHCPNKDPGPCPGPFQALGQGLSSSNPWSPNLGLPLHRVLHGKGCFGPAFRPHQPARALPAQSTDLITFPAARAKSWTMATSGLSPGASKCLWQRQTKACYCHGPKTSIQLPF